MTRFTSVVRQLFGPAASPLLSQSESSDALELSIVPSDNAGASTFVDASNAQTVLNNQQIAALIFEFLGTAAEVNRYARVSKSWKKAVGPENARRLEALLPRFATVLDTQRVAVPRNTPPTAAAVSAGHLATEQADNLNTVLRGEPLTLAGKIFAWAKTSRFSVPPLVPLTLPLVVYSNFLEVCLPRSTVTKVQKILIGPWVAVRNGHLALFASAGVGNAVGMVVGYATGTIDNSVWILMGPEIGAAAGCIMFNLACWVHERRAAAPFVAANTELRNMAARHLQDVPAVLEDDATPELP